MVAGLVGDVVVDVLLGEEHPRADADVTEAAREPFAVHGVAMDAEQAGDFRRCQDSGHSSRRSRDSGVIPRAVAIGVSRVIGSGISPRS